MKSALTNTGAWLLCFAIGAFWTYVLLCVGGK